MSILPNGVVTKPDSKLTNTPNLTQKSSHTRSQSIPDSYPVKDGQCTLIDPSSRTAIVYHKDTLLHQCLDAHPERWERAYNIRDSLTKQGLLNRCKFDIVAREVTRSELELTHSPKHITKILSHTSGYTDDLDTDGDTFMNEHSCRAAKLACGGVIELMEKIILEEIDNGLAIVRPPGHHCFANKPSGFCLFNNIAVAVNVMRNRYPSFQKYIIIDWDVHCGNGTQKIFYDDANVVCFSIHRYDQGSFYPGMIGSPSHLGSKNAIGGNINVTLSKGCGDDTYKYVWQHLLLPIVNSFKPDMIVIAAGFDACIGDPLGGMRVTPPCFGELTAMLCQVCSKIVAVLEGGYNLITMPAAATCAVSALIYQSFEESQFQRIIKDLASYSEWKSLLTQKEIMVRQARLKSKVGFALGYFDANIVTPETKHTVEEMKLLLAKYWPIFQRTNDRTNNVSPVTNERRSSVKSSKSISTSSAYDRSADIIPHNAYILPGYTGLGPTGYDRTSTGTQSISGESRESKDNHNPNDNWSPILNQYKNSLNLQRDIGADTGGVTPITPVNSVPTLSIVSILTEIGIEAYLKGFEMEEILPTDLLGMSEDDLKKLLPKIGPRCRLKLWLETNRNLLCSIYRLQSSAK